MAFVLFCVLLTDEAEKELTKLTIEITAVQSVHEEIEIVDDSGAGT